MNKAKWGTAAVIVLSGTMALASLVGAQTSTTTTGTALTTSCSASVAGNVITWTALANGGTSPYHFAWSGDPSVAGATSTSVTASYSANATYTAMITTTDSASSTATATSSCSGTVTSIVPPTPTSTPPAPFVMKPTLSIGENGRFLARGMRVTSVGSSSFQGTVWGIAYTVNWSGNLNGPEFWFRFNQANNTSTVQNQIQVGDEVGVAGKITDGAPFVVNAEVVRDYSIMKAREFRHEDDENKNEDHGDEEHGKGNGIGIGFGAGSGISANGEAPSVSNSDAANRLNDLLKQLKGLQDLFRNRGGHGNGNGED